MRHAAGQSFALCIFSLLSLPLAAERLPQVAVAVATETPIVEEITVTGSVVAPQISRLSTEVAGWVQQVHVEPGDRVQRGQALVELDAELGRIALDMARAAAGAARATLAEADRRLGEAARLAEQKTIAVTELGARQAEVEIATATLAEREAEARRQQALLERHVLAAPYTGAISRKLTNAGEWVQPGTAVLELVEVDNLRIDFEVPQAFFPRLSPGMVLDARIDALDAGASTATVLTAVPVSDPQSRTFLLLTRPAAHEGELIPGMSARGRIRLDAGVLGVTIPRDALLRYPDGRTTVWVVARDETGVSVSERRVESGRGFDGLIEISTGLDAGAEVVVRGNEGLVEGQRVVIGASE